MILKQWYSPSLFFFFYFYFWRLYIITKKCSSSKMLTMAMRNQLMPTLPSELVPLSHFVAITCLLCSFTAEWMNAAAAQLLQSCPTLCDPHRGQPTSLHRPWESPGKNTGVGCHLEGYNFAFITAQCIIWASPVAQMLKHLPAMRETRVRSLATHSRILAGESHGWRSLVGYSPWGRKRLARLSDFTVTFNA